MQAHRRAVLFLLAILILAGAGATWTLPVSLFPQVDFPRIVVSLDAGDRPVERMTTEVTIPIENAVRSVPGLRSIRSASTRGSAEVSINFDWGADMISALLQVESAVNRTLSSLPPGTTFEARRMDPTVFPSIAYSLTSSRRSLVALRDIAYYQLRPLLSAVDGVAQVAVLGGAEAEYRVTIDPAQLEAHGLTVGDVARALSAANTISAVGRIEDHYKLYLTLVDNRLATAEQLGATVLTTRPAGLLRVADIGTVTLATKPQWTRVTADGREAVIFQVYQQPGGNTVQIAADVRAKLKGVTGQLPPDVKVANWYDQSQLIVAAEKSVRDAVAIGVLLAGAVLLLFLRNGKITLIAIVCVPASLAATVLLLKLLHGSFNIMTLGGMAAAVGLIIDDAIVMVEHVVRRLRGSTGPHHGRVWAAAAEFTEPLVASSLSTVIIFAPLAFLSGVTGAFFRALSLTMAASLVISFLLAWLAVPILADHFLTAKDAQQREGGALTTRVHRAYDRLMRRVLGRPALILLGIGPLLVAAWFGYRQVGSGFMPSMDEGGFILDYRAASGTSLTETDRLLSQVEAILQATPEVETYSRRTGLQLGGGLTEANEGDFFIRLKPPPRRDIDDVIDEVRTKVHATVPGLEIEMAELMEDLIGDLTAVPQPIEIKLYADDGALLQRTAPHVADAIGRIPGVVDVKDGIVLAGDALNITVDRDLAAREGMDPQAITTQLADLLGGAETTTKIEQGPKLVGIRVWIPTDERRTAEDIARLRLRAPDGHYFPAQRVAAISRVVGQPQISRDNLKRMLAVTARISGRDLGSTIRDVQAALRRPGTVPAGMYFALGGTYAQQRSAFTGLMLVFGAAVALVFLLLLFLYESFFTAGAMLVSTLLALSAVMIGLWLTHTELNISSMMGLTMIVGIATEVAIFYVSEFESLPADLPTADALVQAGVNRLRPITMTTFAAILALLPLALGLGAGSAMQQPLAIAIVSGLLLQMPVVLIVLPVLLSLRHPRPPTT
ncbi:efflux RND transporter permease subunit [Horticoccus luteus]|uniref:Efflux RND transporter permease subunit n=1 Tax=Horticoccus luteus TaxID=2862869 RepID=A0A8F9TWN0_9BACT|nr:efflux RND transporter permease subunit [Horticoccus luteus]QYM79648.1 efflux RND transporter permease subunit [Horticoccus luteus]